VLADEKDIARLKGDLPNLIIEWNLPAEADTAKLRSAFKSYWESGKPAAAN